MNLIEIKIIALLLCVGSLVGYHFVAVHNAVSEAHTEDKAAFQAQVEKVNAEAKADHEAQQATIDNLAQSAQPEIAAKLSSINGMLAKLKSDAAKPPVVFKQDCVMAPDQVSAYNSIK